MNVEERKEIDYLNPTYIPDENSANHNDINDAELDEGDNELNKRHNK